MRPRLLVLLWLAGHGGLPGRRKLFDVPRDGGCSIIRFGETKEKERLTLESGNTIDLFDKTDSLTVPSGDKNSCYARITGGKKKGFCTGDGDGGAC